MTDLAQARTNMVDCQIHTSGVVDERILSVFETMPREVFLPEDKRCGAYADEDVIIDGRIHMMEPMVHARLLEAAELDSCDVVLDIGCASGYSAAVLSTMVQTVLAVEEDKALLKEAEKNWNDLVTCNIVPVGNDLAKGDEKNAPYDKIIINGAVAEIPQNLVNQLKPGGLLLCILKAANEVTGKAVKVTHLGDGQYSLALLFDAATPHVKGFEPRAGFVF